MNFSKKHMLSMGWSEGTGLGASGTGITAALKPKFKFNTNGLGFPVTHESDNEWWNQSFNCSANYVDFKICHTQSGLRVKARDKRKKARVTTDETNAAEESESKKYQNFVKCAAPEECVATDDGSDGEKPLDPKLSKNIDFDELYRKSGGVTGHKASRVGIKMSGKLKRIEEQNEEFVRKYKKLKQRIDS